MAVEIIYTYSQRKGKSERMIGKGRGHVEKHKRKTGKATSKKDNRLTTTYSYQNHELA